MEYTKKEYKEAIEGFNKTKEDETTLFVATPELWAFIRSLYSKWKI